MKSETTLMPYFRDTWTLCQCITLWNLQYTIRSAIADCIGRRVWNVKRASFLLVLGAFSPNFTGTRSSPAKMLIPFDRQVIAQQICPGSFQTMKLCSRLLMLFVGISAKITNLGICTPFGEVRGDARPWLMARWKANGRLFIRFNWTFSLSAAVPELWGEMCTARLFSQGVDFFALKFYVDRALILTQYRSVTDGRTDRFALAYIAFAKLSLRRAVKIQPFYRYRFYNQPERETRALILPDVWLQQPTSEPS